MEWPLQHCNAPVIRGRDNNSGISEGPNTVDVLEVTDADIYEDVLGELDDLEASVVSEDAKVDEISGGNGNEEALDVVGYATLDEILDELNSPEPSEIMKAAILQDFFGEAHNIGASDIMQDGMMNEISEDIDYKDASEATETPLTTPMFESPSEVRGAMFACPFKDSLGCNRTFSHLGYAKNHAKVHSHHIRCHFKSCRSRFDAPESLERHLNRTHGLEDIADLDSSFKGPLRENDGKYSCRFRELLGCKKVFSQNGHANRHALLHCKMAIPCNVRGCRMKFMKKENWEEHFWTSHHQVLD